MVQYFDPNYLLGEFRLFSLPHIIALLVVAALNVIMVLALKRVNSEKVNKYFCYILSFILLAQELSLNIWYICVGKWSVGHHLPLHLCGLAVVLSPIMLIGKKSFYMNYSTSGAWAALSSRSLLPIMLTAFLIIEYSRPLSRTVPLSWP